MTDTNCIISAHDTYMTLNYPRFPIAMVSGKGCRLTDADGKEYLDLFSGFGAGVLGHAHPELVEAVSEQAGKLWHVGNLLHTEPQTRLAKHIHDKGFGGRSFFCHSGSDANEAAFKLARLYGEGKRYKIISATHSFHGRGFAAMMATGQEKVRHGFAPYLPGFEYVPYNDIEALKSTIDGETVAIILEPIQGEGGVNVPDEQYLSQVSALCKENDLLLIMDEVWTGCGRTGEWFAYQHWGIEPDILTLGKAVGVGLALGVMCASERVADRFDFNHYKGVAHATTLGGNCITAAASARMFEVIERNQLVSRAGELGQSIMHRLGQLKTKNAKIKDIRGKGLFIGIEVEQSASEVVKQCLDRGLLIGSAQSHILRFAPPMTVSDDEIDEGLNILEEILS